VNGVVDDAGRALIQIRVRASSNEPERDALVWIDTAFDGELVLPERIVREMNLVHTGAMSATLADGREVILESFHCSVEWFGTWRDVEVIANEGRLPLLGIGLLRDRQLFVDFVGKSLMLS
jgi:clan AA aspartic protease